MSTLLLVLTEVTRAEGVVLFGKGVVEGVDPSARLEITGAGGRPDGGEGGCTRCTQGQEKGVSSAAYTTRKYRFKRMHPPHIARYRYILAFSSILKWL